MNCRRCIPDFPQLPGPEASAMAVSGKPACRRCRRNASGPRSTRGRRVLRLDGFAVIELFAAVARWRSGISGLASNVSLNLNTVVEITSIISIVSWNIPCHSTSAPVSKQSNSALEHFVCSVSSMMRQRRFSIPKGRIFIDKTYTSYASNSA
jgi:hypothetical protein